MLILVEPAEVDLMDRKPRPAKQSVLTLSSMMIIAWQSLSMTYLTFGVYYLAVYQNMFGANTPRRQKSLAFILLCTLQLVQSLFSRSILNSAFKVGLFGNSWLIIAFVISYGLMLFGLYVPPVANWLELEGIGAEGWAPIAVCLVIHIVMIELGKYCARLLFAKEVINHSEKQSIPAIVVMEEIHGKEPALLQNTAPTYNDFSEPKKGISANIASDSTSTVK